MRHIRYSQIRIKDSSMMLIEKVDSELEDFDKAVSILEDLVEEGLNLILVILEICSVECLEEDLAEEDPEEKQEAMI
jgi:hypothetical protein